MSFFSLLPEGCITDIISFTSPRDSCRASAISPTFKSAAESDIVWEKFLPSDYQEIISRSVSPVVHSTKKELYFLLCNSPILLDESKLSFTLNKWSGKKCYMLRARELSIAWKDGPQYWKWTSLPESRFFEVAELRAVCWLAVGGKMQTQMLSPKTTYAAYLVFKPAENSRGLEVPAKASVRFVVESQDGAKDSNDAVHLKLATDRPEHLRRLGRRAARQPNGRLRQKRGDEWIELGQFFNDHGDDGEVEMQLKEIQQLNWKTGLIVEGIELRPKE
ncbi:unnamed protein product [Ilex paraguariensis]|uniref:F-box domain-containing protein n=1 Tax=Ilex paraguariensis TaxID=185542 RepID=A0ABC8RD47_9AQUA